VTGPLIESWPPQGHRLLYGDDAELVPAVEVSKTTRVPAEILYPVREWTVLNNSLTVHLPADKIEIAVQGALTRFISRAFRRPTTSDEVEVYHTIVRDRLAQGECLEVAMNAAHRAVLCSPDFLFLVERSPMLSSHELAARLSYFLWRTCPDATLRELADRDCF
jgi:hypothetical protein